MSQGYEYRHTEASGRTLRGCLARSIASGSDTGACRAGGDTRGPDCHVASDERLPVGHARHCDMLGVLRQGALRH